MASTDEPSDLIGKVIGNYRILSLLADGGMGAIYLAVHDRIERQVAVKVLRAQYSTQPQVIARFFNEARAAHAIGHPGIIDIFDLGLRPDVGAFLIMERLEGETLATRLRRTGRLTVGQALDIGDQIASAIGAAHARGIIHRDLTPSNLFLVADPARPSGVRVKVLDFGIAKLTGDLASTETGTQAGTVMGTPAYMAPEQCLGIHSEVDHHADIYATGCILYHMLCGEAPFGDGGVPGDLMIKHLTLAVQPLRERVPEVPARLEQAVLRALGKRAEDRFASMAELQAALADAGGRSFLKLERRRSSPTPAPASPRLTPLQAQPPPTPPGAGRTRRVLRWVGPLVLGGTLAGGLSWRASRTPPPAVTVQSIVVRNNDDALAASYLDSAGVLVDRKLYTSARKLLARTTELRIDDRGLEVRAARLRAAVAAGLAAEASVARAGARAGAAASRVKPRAPAPSEGVMAAVRAPIREREKPPAAPPTPEQNPIRPAAMTAPLTAPAPAPRVVSRRPTPQVLKPTLPRTFRASDPAVLAAMCARVENAATSLAAVSAAFARGVTQRLCQEAGRNGPSEIYPVAMYYFIVREAGAGRDNLTAAEALASAQRSHLILKFKDLPAFAPGTVAAP